MSPRPLCISCQPEDLDQGLFGNVFIHTFQILPYLYSRGIFPAWQLRTKHYGDPPDFITIPGVVDLVYAPPAGPYRMLDLNELRRRHAQVLGSDWDELGRIWNAYFRVPQRITQAADEIFQGNSGILGVHYRGTDKQTASWDSNPISQEQYLSLIREFLAGRSDFKTVFAATDEFSFVEKLRASIDLPVISLGEVEFHMAANHSTSRAEKNDRAMLDCVLLSRCNCVIETSSALPSFARLFNPALEIYRCAASKLFNNMPYFPVAPIPVLPVSSAAAADILCQTMKDDWRFDLRMQKYTKTFSFVPRWPMNHRLFGLTDKIGVSDLVAKFVNGYR